MNLKFSVMQRILLFCLSWGFFVCAYQFWFVYGKDIEELGTTQVLLSPFAFSFMMIEYLLLALLLSLLNLRGRIYQILRFILVLVVIGIQTTQFYSLYYSNDFIEAGVVAHVALALLLVNRFTLLTLAVLVGGMLLSYRQFEKHLTRYPSFKSYWRANVILLVIAALAMVGNKHIKFVQETKLQYRAGLESGIAAFFKMAFGFRNRVVAKTAAVKLLPEDTITAKRLGFELDQSAEYPFRHFSRSRSYSNNKNKQQPNLIVLFVESLSADLVGVYHSKWRDVTPQINKFAEKALVVDQYHNHVTPTIVGLRGQLCSNFPSLSHTMWDRAKFKLETGSAYCLPHILEQHRYETTYLGYSQKNETFFADQMAEMGFGQTFFYEELLKKFRDSNPKPELGLRGNSDRQMFSALQNFLIDRQSAAPFFVAVSTVETHPGMDVREEERRYPGFNSAILNVVHNFDYQLGRFLNYFFASPWAENTILILTADHSHTPSVELRQVASERYIDDVFNEIALMIYDPFRKSQGRQTIPTTSIDFAPTVLDLLYLDPVESPFLGRSIFELRDASSISTGLAFQERLFRLQFDGNRSLKRMSLEKCDQHANPSEDWCSLFRLLRYSQNITEERRLWPETMESK